MYTTRETRPNTPRVKLDQAIKLAKAGRKSEARQVLREVVAVQPVNQAAWLWLSAVAAEQSEAEAALTQAKKINPEHPTLSQAEEWLAHRFTASTETKKNAPVNPKITPTVSPSSVSRSSKSPLKTKKLLKLFNVLAFGLVVLAIVLGLVVLILGLIWEINAPAFADDLLSARDIEHSSEAITIRDAYTAELDAAFAAGDWAAAAAILGKLHESEPSSARFRDKLAYAHTQLGLNLRHRGFVEEALINFERALEVSPGQAQARQEAGLASVYLDGVQHYQRGNWQAAIAEFESVWAEDTSYGNLKDLLYSAYYNHALALQAAGELPAAKAALETASLFHPELSDPRRLIAELEFEMSPQTPLAEPLIPSIEDRIIVVGIAEQRMVVYDGPEQVFEFVISTGEPGRDTAIGEFEILNKIDMAYASTWNLDMPYWMGIYWSGPLQNGIHSLPIVKHTGYKLWDGYLGQRVSYGCVILSDEDAATLYEWTEVGTKVKIVPSLAYWSPEEELELQIRN